MNSIFLILIIATAGAPIERSYEFQSAEDCAKAVAQVRAAYAGKTQQPLVFCSPSSKPFQPWQTIPGDSKTMVQAQRKGSL